MKILIAAVITALTFSTAQAQHRGYNHRGHGGNFIAPLIIGGVIGYSLARPADPVFIQPQPVYEPTYVVPPQPVYSEVVIWDERYRCWVKVYRQVGWK